MKLSEFLEHTKSLILDPKKWGRRWKWSRPGTYCLGEAIDYTAIDHDLPMSDVKYSVAYKARRILQNCSGGYSCVSEFNDKSTHQQVIDLLDQTIEQTKLGERSE